MSNTPEPAKGDQLAELKREVEAKIRQLRELAGDVVSIDLGDGIDIELGTMDETGRVLVGKKGHGTTLVKYNHEGLIVDVWPENHPDGPLEPMFTTFFYNGDLTGDE